MNQLTLESNAMPTIIECNFFIATEPFFHPDRILDFHVLVYVTEGVIYVTEEDQDYEILPGDLLFLKKGLHHFGKKPIPKGTQWHFVHFYMPDLQNLPCYDTSLNTIPNRSMLAYSLPLPKKLSNLTHTTIERELFTLTNFIHQEDSMNAWNSNALLFHLLTELAFSNIAPQSAPSLSDRICQYLTDHMREPFSAKDLEQHFYLSYKHLAAQFKLEKQLTMQQYHTMLRMNAACKLLKSTLLSISEISESMGYSDLLYFSRCFHQFSGMSPTAYRKSLITSYQQSSQSDLADH